ncbi:MAG TPA: LCP family protein [Thermoanaerobaculia bacterium]|nr:LCP family protein [Thermoanaerobaculia bacterium]
MYTFDADSSFSRLKQAALARASKEPPKPTRTQRALEWTLFVVSGLVIALAGVGLYATSQPEHQKVPNRVSAGITSDRINLLMMGVSATRTESLMLLSIQPSTGRAALMSVPIDLWVKVGRYGQRPLRDAQKVGDAAGYPGGGVGLTVETVESIIAEPIHGYARFSIGDVQRAIDAMNGIDVDVKHGIYDYRSKARFRKGEAHFDGKRAIRYAYSGSIAGVAASNRFAKEERQQDVLLETLTKAAERDPDSLQSVFGALAATNLSAYDMDVLVTALRRGDGIRRISFAPFLDSFDVTSVAYRGEVVGPRSGDFGALQKIADAALLN